MIVHCQIFDAQTKRSLADYCVTEDDLTYLCEQFFAKLDSSKENELNSLGKIYHGFPIIQGQFYLVCVCTDTFDAPQKLKNIMEIELKHLDRGNLMQCLILKLKNALK